MYMEDHPLFNAGRGSAITNNRKVEMCASIMNGKTLNSGACAVVRDVKNPIHLARIVMDKTDHIYVGGPGATKLAREYSLPIEDDKYFLTDHMLKELAEAQKKEQKEHKKVEHGTVGAVACDKHGNIAAGTSTGGLSDSRMGRIADSSMVGVGCYALNKTCAVSSTGDGEYSIRGVVCHEVSSVMEHRGYSLQDALHYVVHVRNKGIKGDMGIIGVDAKGNIGCAFNSERMHRGWRTSQGDHGALIYRD